MKIQSTLFASLLFSTQIYFAQETRKEETKEKQIEAVTITKTKKAVEQKADRTIFDFSEQPNLNSGTLMDGLKKLPGLVSTDVAGMMYQGKMLEVFMDGRPLNISSNELTAFLEGMPANSVERIEVITQPGAEFPATSGGAILNIITSKNAKSYLSATYSGSYAFSNYDKVRNKTVNSLNLNATNKYFGWQVTFGQNYRENAQWSEVDDLSKNFSDKTGRGYFGNAAMTFDLGADRLLLNYELNKNNNDNVVSSNGFRLVNNILSPVNSEDFGKTFTNRNDATITYQKRFSDKNKKLDFQLNYNNYNTDFSQNSFTNPSNNTANASNQNVYSFKVDFSQALKILDEGKISIGGLYEKLNFDTDNKIITNLDYQRQTSSLYAELQAKLKKFDFILGARGENYDISGITRVFDNNAVVQKDLTPFNQFRIFPNASVQYNFMQSVYFSFNYNKKISLPNITFLNPNNTVFNNQNINYSGNPFLQPTIFDNFEVKISAFDYAYISYSISYSDNNIAQQVGRKDLLVTNTNINIPTMRIHSFNAGLPVPFMIFTKSLSEMLKFDFNPDKINFLYLFTSYQKHEIPALNNKGFWVFGGMAQIILPKEIKFTANYRHITKGNYFYFDAVKPFNQSVDLNLTKKLMNDRLTITLYADDVFNMNRNTFNSVPPNDLDPVLLTSKNDTRKFGISFNYKIPTKNKLAKVDPNLIKTNNSDSSSGLLNQDK
ncbi:outer membrane beta-barrel protein [Epilithonimonas sp. UC225_85]|uniref:outer membrane beta-barrel protein n=1 Tax=Epilithonimonas sp. UC225_85 TaxID=3350167 RepID=UPI0036D40C7A